VENASKKGRCISVDDQGRSWKAIVVPKKKYDEIPIPSADSAFWSVIGVDIAGTATYEADSSFSADVTISRFQHGRPPAKLSVSGTVFFVSRSANLKRIPRAVAFLEELRTGQHAEVTVVLGRRR
jgi:hypothetical protein